MIYFLVFALLLAACHFASSAKVTFDGRSFMLDGERKLFIAGSIHYPRAPRSEWPAIFKLAKDSGLNLIQTYVFWDIHEPENDQWNFPNDPSSNHDLVAFVQEAAKQGLYVHLRIAGYICAEWNFGGLPGWLRELNSTLRTYDDVWMQQLSQFVEKTLTVVKDANLLYGQGGPIVMLQIENEYGNMEGYYGQKGHAYVSWLSQYAQSLDTGGVPWIMCQQGEGTGTAPDASIVNTCNGFYCDNWISQHAAAFPSQPHMFTELWPGWFQNWGEPIPHRPAVDVAFSVARWFARGGSYVNYYMAFGGSTFGRDVGGPLIVTSYDYDVQIDEFVLPAEPKFSLLQQLHTLLRDNKDLLLQQMPPQAVPLSGHGDCESHTYSKTAANGQTSCIAFYSNWDEQTSCSFPLAGGRVESVPAWSVSIGVGEDCSSIVFNTKTSALAIATTQKTYTQVMDFVPKQQSSRSEPVPSDKNVVQASLPLEQLSLTHDHTDYLWYSASLPATTTGTGTLQFASGTAGGSVFYIYVDKQLQVMVSGDAGANPITSSSKALKEVRHFNVNITMPAGRSSVLDILSVSMGLKNYGPFLETIQVGIVSELTLDGHQLGSVSHAVGLQGESEQLPLTLFQSVAKEGATSRQGNCSSLCWHVMSFKTPSNLSPTSRLSLDLASSLTKGAAWVNGHMLGRYWNIVANPSVSQGKCYDCPSADYVGGYNGDKCRSGCGQPSQQYYKLPAEWLNFGDQQDNVLVIFEEINGKPEDIKMFEVSKVAV